jgi:hypothetical protein
MDRWHILKAQNYIAYNTKLVKKCEWEALNPTDHLGWTGLDNVQTSDVTFLYIYISNFRCDLDEPTGCQVSQSKASWTRLQQFGKAAPNLEFFLFIDGLTILYTKLIIKKEKVHVTVSTFVKVCFPPEL